MNKHYITGLLAATVTPFHEDGTVNLEMIPIIVDHLTREGVSGIYALGTTGESGLLRIDERQAIAEAFIRAADGRMPVVVQVGHESVSETCRLAAHAERLGAFALSAVSPSYFAPASLDRLVDWIATVAAAAPTTPFYYYHIPARTGIEYSMVKFLHQCAERIPTLRGIKFTSCSLHEYQACLELRQKRFDILYGHDEMLLGALAVGGRGAVGSTYNFSAKPALRILAACSRGDWEDARQAQSLLGSMIQILSRYEFIPALKAVMKMIGLDCGPCRLPLLALSADEYANLKTDLEAIGFLSKSSNELMVVNDRSQLRDSMCVSDRP